MPQCSVCRRGFPESQLHRCYDCGKAYCPECAEKDPTIKGCSTSNWSNITIFRGGGKPALTVARSWVE